jgi:hypothetical protein
MKPKLYIVLVLVVALIASTITVSLGNKDNAPGQNKKTSEDEIVNEQLSVEEEESAPGNSENAPGQEKVAEEQELILEEESAPGNSENAPGQEKSPAALTAWAANTLANMPQPIYSERAEALITVPSYLQDAPGNTEAQAFRKWLDEIAPEYDIYNFHMRGLSGVALVFHYPKRNSENPLLPELPPNNPHLNVLNPPLP